MLTGETIGDWDSTRLWRYVLNIIKDAPARIPRSLELDTVRTTKKLIVADDIELSPQAVEKLKQYLGL